MAGERAAAVAGDVALWRRLSRTQPGARGLAPGALALVQSFVNSHYDLDITHGRDLFESPDALADWLVARRLMARAEARLDGGDRERAVALREGLRALLAANRDRAVTPWRDALAALNVAGAGATVEVRLTVAGPRFEPVGATALDRALAIVLAITAASMLEGTWPRMKACPGEHCGWAFYDGSRNASGRWCAMTVCGGRAKARAHYRRHRTGGMPVSGTEPGLTGPGRD